jgi:hypothetical protein
MTDAAGNTTTMTTDARGRLHFAFCADGRIPGATAALIVAIVVVFSVRWASASAQVRAPEVWLRCTLRA